MPRFVISDGVNMAQQTQYAKYTTTITRARRRKFSAMSMRRVLRWFAPLLTLLMLLAAWQGVYASGVYPTFIIPAPLAVWEKFVEVAADGTLIAHIQVTLGEMLAGLGVGVALALLLGYAIAKVDILGDLLSPIVVALQSTPIVAYAPLLFIWFGSGPTSKIITSALIVFFPMLMNTIVGLRNVPESLRELMRVMRASPIQTFLKLEVPAALPVLLTGLKTSATLAMIGAVVGEFVSARAGLGFLVNIGRSQFDTPLVLVAVLTMTAISLVLYASVSLLEWALLRWQHRTTT